jgi:TorA maturation chaperone TorD
MLQKTADPLIIAKGRGNVYHLLAMLYLKEASPEFLTQIKSKEISESLNELDIDFGSIFNNKSQEELIDELSQEYAALFIVPGGIPPYESVRLKDLLNQEPAWKTEEFYKRCGLIIKEDCKTFPDHLGMELEFMAYLSDKESTAWEEKDEKAAAEWNNLQKEFFSNHINKWVFGFLDDLDRFAFHPFYKEVAKLTKGFLETEREGFNER